MHDFWAIQGTNSTNGQLVLVVFEVFETPSNIDLSLVTLCPIMVSTVMPLVKEMKYSTRWGILAFSTLSPNSIENDLVVFSVGWNSTIHRPYLSLLGAGSAFLYQISPFLVQTFSFHEEIPLLLMGI